MTDKILLIPGTIFLLMWVFALFSFLKPEFPINVNLKYYSWLLKWSGFEGEIRPTPKAKIIYRAWSLFTLLFLPIFVLFMFRGKSKY